MNNKTQLMVELYDLSITERKDDRFGRVIASKNLNEDDLVKLAVSRRTDLNPATLKASLELLKDVAMEEILGGASVSLGFANISLGVNGIFIGDNAQWDSTKHSISVKMIPNAVLRNAVKKIAVNVRGMAANGTVINMVVDVASGEENGRLTAGGGLNIFGSRIKIDGDKEGVGLRLVHQESGKIIKIPMTSVLVNQPSQVAIILPSDLEAGEYKLTIGTQYSKGAQLLKEVKEYEFEYILSVL